METAYRRWSCSPSDLVGLTATRARDLIVRCFFEAQHEMLARDNEIGGLGTDSKSIRSLARGAVQEAFSRTGGDFKNPDKTSLLRVLGGLAESAQALGAPRDIIEHHTQQIVTVLAELSD
jgi:hypothetical protein